MMESAMNIEEKEKKESMNKLEIEYPCEWSYKVIGTDEDALREAISKCAEGADHRISHSKSSSAGRYVSLNLEAVVDSEEIRIKIYHSLSGHASVKIVL